MYDTAAIAKTCHLAPETIRAYFARAPAFQLGAIDGRGKIYSDHEALVVVIAAEIMRHGLGRPHEVLPIARQVAASSSSQVWAHRPPRGEITITEDQPLGAIAVAIPVDFLRARLSSVASQPKGTTR